MRSGEFSDTIIERRDLISAVPKALRPDARRVVRRLRPFYSEWSGNEVPPKGNTPVFLEGERLQLPKRIYYEPTQPQGLFMSRDGISLAWDCIFSTHHDGYVREAAIARAIASNSSAVIPFVVQQLGEYVIEIHRTIESALANSAVTDEAFARFAADNQGFMRLTLARAASYRQCYFRFQPDYPALRLLHGWFEQP